MHLYSFFPSIKRFCEGICQQRPIRWVLLKRYFWAQTGLDNQSSPLILLRAGTYLAHIEVIFFWSRFCSHLWFNEFSELSSLRSEFSHKKTSNHMEIKIIILLQSSDMTYDSTSLWLLFKALRSQFFKNTQKNPRVKKTQKKSSVWNISAYLEIFYFISNFL